MNSPPTSTSSVVAGSMMISGSSTPSTPVSIASTNVFGGIAPLLPSASTESSVQQQQEHTPSSKGVRAWQICPGSINPYHQAFSWTTHMGDEMIAYASGKYIMIYSGNNFLQILEGHDDIVTCVKWSNLHSRIAACSKGKIIIYSQVEEDETEHGFSKKTPTWAIEQIINSVDIEFDCMDWNLYGDRLIVGGRVTMILEGVPVLGQIYKWNVVWRYENPTPVHIVAYSPDEKYFATVSKYDRLVKVWYRNKPIVIPSFTPVISITDTQEPSAVEEEAEAFSYIYLPHPRSVTSLSWRFKEIGSQKKDEFAANVLLTTSIDNVVRVWSETNETEDLSFYVCSIIEKETQSNVQWLNTAFEKSPNQVLLQYLRKKRKKSYEGDHKDIVLDNDQRPNLESKLQTASSDTGLFESQTWLGTVQSDGTLMIDLLQGLADFPRRTPKTSMWIRMPNALKGFEDPLNVFMFYKTADDSNMDLGSTTPKILTIYVHSKNGMLSNWELNLSKGSRPQLEVFSVFTGHVGEANCLVSHPTLPVVASLDKVNNHLIAWHVRDTPFYCPRDILTNIKEFKLEATNIAWYPTTAHLLCSTNNGIEIIYVKSTNPLAHNLTAIYESTTTPPLPSYYDIVSCNYAMKDSEEFRNCLFMKVLPFGTIPTETEKSSNICALVVAITANGKTVGVWKLEEVKQGDSITFVSELITKHNIEGTATCADCVKLVPFIPEMHKNITTMPTELTMKNYYAKQQNLAIVIGKSDGTVTVLKLAKKDKAEPVKEAPKPKIGGLLGKFTATSSSSNTTSSTSSTSTANDKPVIEKWFDFTAENSSVKLVKCSDTVTRIATACSDSKDVHIWEAESHTDFTIEQTIEIDKTEIVHDLEWTSFGDGQSILIIGSNKKLYCLTESKVQPGLFKDKKKYWHKITTLLPSVNDMPCSKISVSKERSIIAAFGSALHVFTKTLHGDDSKRFMAKFNIPTEPSIKSQTLLMHRRLADYHPNFLLELLMDGRFDTVKKVIYHVVKHLQIFEEKVEKKKGDKLEEYLNKGKDYAYLLEIPSLKVTTLIKEEEKKQSSSSSEPTQPRRRTLLDKYSSVNIEEPKVEAKTSSLQEETEEDMSIEEAVRILKTSLASVHLPGLSKHDQINLIAVIDTYLELQKNPEALDAAGIRYLVAVKFLQYLAKRSQIGGQSELLLNKVNSSMIAWALISETQDSLWNMLCPETASISWKLIQQLGVIYWQKNPGSLKAIAERLAKQIFKETNDPSKCALYYMALKKKGALSQLFKLKGNEKVADFLNKNFNEEKNRNSAVKNAYVLLSRHDVNYAAAYFLLADSPKDAVSVLVKNSKEYDLAYFIARLYCGDDSAFCKNLLKNEITQYYSTEEKDIWMQSIIKWTLKEYENAVEILVKRGSEDDETFDPSLFAYCLKLDSKPSLNNSDIISKHILPILQRTAHYFYQIGAYTLSLEYLLKLKNIDQYTSKRKLTSSSNDALMSGTFSGFGGGMGGFDAFGGFGGGMMGMGMMGMGMSGSSSSTKLQVESKEAKEQPEITELLKLKTALSILCQELYDLCYNAESDYREGWDRNRNKIMSDIDDLVAKLDIDKNMLLAQLKQFTKLNGFLIARCLLCNDGESILAILETFAIQIGTTISLVIKNPLTPSHVSRIEHQLKEFIYCYSRMRSLRVKISEQQQADLSSTLFSMLFTTLYSKRDFDGLYILFNLHQDFDKKERDSFSDRPSFEGREVFDKFYHLLFDRMTLFYKRFNLKMIDFKINKAMQEEIDQEEKKKKKLANLSKNKVLTKDEAEKKKEYYKKLLENYHGTPAADANEKSSELEKLEKQFHWEMFDSVLVFKFTTALKDFIEHAYDETYSSFVKQSQKKREDISKQKYSSNAQTALTCSSLWCSYLERRLQYKEMEIYSENGSSATPNLKEVSALSTRTHLSSMLETLTQTNPGPKHMRTISAQDHFHSLAHALPELGLENSNIQQTLLLSCINKHWLADEKIFDTFKGDHSTQKLWSFLLDVSKPKPISSSTSMNVSLTVAPTITTSDTLSSLTSFMDPTTSSGSSTATSSMTKSQTSSSTNESIKFSADIEIVKCKDLVKAFCVDSSNPTYLAFASGKCIREINIEHSIRYRKRNPSLDKLLDDEANSWDQSFHRYDDIAAKDVNNTKFVQQQPSIAKVPSISNFNVFDFLDTVNDDEDASKNLKKFIGFSNPMSSFDSGNNSSYMNKLKQRFSVSKRPSFTATTPSASHFKRQSVTPVSSTKQPTKKSGKVDRNQACNVLVSHPFLPFYLSGGPDGSVFMWQYGFQYALRTYREAGSPVTNIRFSRFGYKFGVTDSSGYLTLWRFDASKESLHYFYHLHCHNIKVNDFTFLESGSLVSTIGLSSKGGELCVWDLFLPNQDAKMFSHVFNGDEPLALRYSPKYKLLLVGTKKGEIHIFDAQESSYGFLHKISTSHDAIQMLNIDVTEEFFVTGCSNGHVSVWDMKTLRQMYYYPDTHPKKKLFTQEGVTWSEISTQFLYTSGGDGRILRKTIV